MVSIIFGAAAVGNSVTIHFESFVYAPSSSTRKQIDQRSQRARVDGHAQRTRNDIFQNIGATVERRNHLSNVGVTPIADRFDCMESGAESVRGVQYLWVKRSNIERALRRTTIWWHGVGAKPRVAATLF